MNTSQATISIRADVLQVLADRWQRKIDAGGKLTPQDCAAQLKAVLLMPNAAPNMQPITAALEIFGRQGMEILQQLNSPRTDDVGR